MKENKPMTLIQFNHIERGAILQNRGSGESYVVETTGQLSHDGNVSHIGVRTVMITNPDEWILMKK